jgi:hypothetical protein
MGSILMATITQVLCMLCLLLCPCRAREEAVTAELEDQRRAAADAQALAQELHQELSNSR